MQIIKGAVAVFSRKTVSGEDEFLLLKHKNGFWSFVGGGIEDTDESVENGLKREIKEELDLDDQSYDLFSTEVVNEFIYGGEKPQRSGKKGITYYFVGKLKNKEEITGAAEISEVGWFVKEKVLELLAFEDMRKKFLEVLEVKSL